MNLRDAAQELLELGLRGTVFRAGWEIKARAGLTTVTRAAAPADIEHQPGAGWTHQLPFEDPMTLARALRERIPRASLQRLKSVADAAVGGRILCFGRWFGDFGDPIDWHRSPVTGRRWRSEDPWFRALADERPGDIKHAWEAARFPHAYHLARAAAFFPESRERYAAALLQQIESFLSVNPQGLGIHWASGQEVGFRLLAWVFAIDALLGRSAVAERAEALVGRALIAGARHIEEHLDYARIAVYNNHLLSEALALFGAGTLIADATDAPRWRDRGRRLLDEQAERQFYADGAYIQQSHNYHRVALHDYLWACSFARAAGDRPSEIWIQALRRSLDFLFAHQNAIDGRLPNYGSNDGALPAVTSTCDFADMRPILQAVSIVARGERLFPAGPWDEEAAWFLGVHALEAPLVCSKRQSVSFNETGYHVLRGDHEGGFAALRCGTLRDRFSQIDMLHLDIWWRGQNVLADAGSYQYNAAPHWHQHFMRTAAHNTVVVDDRDQMVHHRQFKVLYWTRAALQRFEDRKEFAICSGEHYGYRRHPGRCVHRREVLFVKDDLWIVADHVSGHGAHSVRLHWLAGDFEWTAGEENDGMVLRTPEGVFTVRALFDDGRSFSGDVVAADEATPRGWMSRYYGEKVGVPSFAATYQGNVPITFVSILAGVSYDLDIDGRQWTIATPRSAASFELVEGTLQSIVVTQ